MRRSLIWLSGARWQILEQNCPAERPKYSGLGAVILITASMAMVSAAFALVSVLNVPLWRALAFALGWGLAILSLDRLLVVSLQRPEGRRSYWVLAGLRLVLSILLGFVISTPLVLQIFRPEIDYQITRIHDQAAALYFGQLSSGPLGRAITRDAQNVDALAAVTATGGAGTDLATNPNLNKPNADQAQAQAQAQIYYSEWQCQLYGKSPSGTEKCPPGDGVLAAQTEHAYKAEEALAAQYGNQIAAEQQALFAQGKAEQATERSQAAQQLANAKQQLQAAQTEQAQQTAAFRTENRDDTGLLIRLQALSAATAGSFTLLLTRWLLFLLFLFIDCMPVLIKVLLNAGPESDYERALKLRSDADYLAAQAEANGEQNRLAGLAADIPEVTDKLIATRKEVEDAWREAWRADQMQRIARGQGFSSGGAAPPPASAQAARTWFRPGTRFSPPPFSGRASATRLVLQKFVPPRPSPQDPAADQNGNRS